VRSRSERIHDHSPWEKPYKIIGFKVDFNETKLDIYRPNHYIIDIVLIIRWK